MFSWWWLWRLLSVGQKMAAAQSSQISAKIYCTTWCHIPEDNNFKLTNLKSNCFESCEVIRELCTFNMKSVLSQYCRMLLNSCLISSKCYKSISHYLYQSHTKTRKCVCFLLTQNSITNYHQILHIVAWARGDGRISACLSLWMLPYSATPCQLLDCSGTIQHMLLPRSFQNDFTWIKWMWSSGVVQSEGYDRDEWTCAV
jgi:hypothetical protein